MLAQRIARRQRDGATLGAVEQLDHADDPRLADYRQLRDAAARRRIEGDEMFIAEGPNSIERLLASGHRVRSVLLSQEKARRIAPLLDGLEAFVPDLDLRRVPGASHWLIHEQPALVADTIAQRTGP